MNQSSYTAFGIVVLGLALAGYLYFFNPTDTASLATALSSSQPASSAEQTFINLSSELQSISFPTAIFSNPVFMGFTNTHTALTPENPGRPDPFASLSGISSGK